MSSEETKASFFNFSPTVLWGMVLTGLSAGAGTIYVGITTYNRVIAATEAIEEAKPYDDTEIKNEISRLKIQISGLESSVNNVKDGMVQTSNQLVSVSEKASTAKGEAMEAKAIANGNARETQAALGGVREEVKATREGVEAKMKALQRATTNPLGN
jgi:hypothetical protein